MLDAIATLIDLELDVLNKWNYLRTPLFRNVEPTVTLIGHTVFQGLVSPSEIPGYIARKSYESTGSVEENIALTQRLMNFKPKPHSTPLEFFNWVFEIEGISKSSLTQLDRHRMASFVQQSGRYMDRSNVMFVYDCYDKIESEGAVRRFLVQDEEDTKRCVREYESRKNTSVISGDEIGLTTTVRSRQSVRRKLTLDFATSTFMSINSLSLRNLLELRLDSHAEWEIRRIALMIYKIVNTVAPSHFKDMNIKGF